jgi:hypothetical protein
VDEVLDLFDQIRTFTRNELTAVKPSFSLESHLIAYKQSKLSKTAAARL